MADSKLLLRAAVGDRELLIHAGDVEEVVPLEYLIPFPSDLPGLAGIMAHHGEPLPVLDWGPYGAGEADCPFVAVLKRRLGVPLTRILEVRDLEGVPEVGLKRGDPWNPMLGHRRRLSGHSQGVLDVEKLLALLHNRSLRR
ncbi:MAG TPA: hypothetical protein VJ623_01985 [Holophagaceae bacterium]|nr:hypothetical protein [Holophagaceae bacterium]